VHVVGHTQLHAGGLPPRAIADQHDRLARSRADLPGELRQLHRKAGDAHRRRQVEDGPTRGGMHTAHELAPGVAVVHPHHRPLANRRPHPAQQGLEANTLLIGEVRRPEFHPGRGKRGGHRAQQRPYFFLKVACCLGSAKACGGRGTGGEC
jgi:hypothetical protein